MKLIVILRIYVDGQFVVVVVVVVVVIDVVVVVIISFGIWIFNFSYKKNVKNNPIIFPLI